MFCRPLPEVALCHLHRKVSKLGGDHCAVVAASCQTIVSESERLPSCCLVLGTSKRILPVLRVKNRKLGTAVLMLEVSSEPLMISWVSCFFGATFAALDCLLLNTGVLGQVLSDSGG